MLLNEIMSAIFLIAVLFLVLPSFLNTNSKFKQFVKNISECSFIDWQSMRMQENADEIPAGSMPRPE